MNYTDHDFQEAATRIVEASRALYKQGWSPATSSNYSERLGSNHCAITVSGKDKGRLSKEDVMVVDLKGQAITQGQPSAETLLHTTLYAHDPEIGAVLHTHSPHSTLLSQITPGDSIKIEGYELLKALNGIKTHESSTTLPLFDNTQDMTSLSRDVIAYLEEEHRPCYGYLIRGHGVYTWGRDMQETQRHLEALDFLFHQLIEMKKVAP